jgi:hypothetical protein
MYKKVSCPGPGEGKELEGFTECGYIMNTAESSKKQLYNSSRKRNG